MRILIILGFILLSTFSCSGQSSDCPIHITSSENSYRNYFSDSIVTHLNYLTLENRTAEAYYFWIGRGKSYGNSIDKLFLSYFYGIGNHPIPFGDILMDDANPLSSHAIQEIGYNFIKLLQPNEKFIILMPTEEESANFYRQRFVFISENELEQRVGAHIKFFTYLPPFLDLRSSKIKNMIQ